MRLNLAHAGIGRTLAEASEPGYLRTPRGTVALVSMASGFVPEGGAAKAAGPGVNELRVDGGKTPNQEDAQRILQSICTARANADPVVAYQHNHVFDIPFGTIMSEELPERLAPPDWLKTWAHDEVDAGADVVVNARGAATCGPQILRPPELSLPQSSIVSLKQQPRLGGYDTAMSNRPSFPRTVYRLLKDLLTMVRPGLTSQAHVAAESLFLRKQLTLYVVEMPSREAVSQ
jgi:hypothetical protein